MPEKRIGPRRRRHEGTDRLGAALEAPMRAHADAADAHRAASPRRAGLARRAGRRPARRGLWLVQYFARPVAEKIVAAAARRPRARKCPCQPGSRHRCPATAPRNAAAAQRGRGGRRWSSPPNRRRARKPVSTGGAMSSAILMKDGPGGRRGALAKEPARQARIAGASGMAPAVAGPDKAGGGRADRGGQLVGAQHERGIQPAAR